jgi:uncharacterized protein (DUF302 family)
LKGSLPRFAGLRRVVICAALAGGTPCAAAPAAEPPAVYERTAQKPLAQVVEDAEFAIVERNFRITGNLHIGKGIRERDGDDFPDHEVILFCNLGYAREMLELDPGFINFCPGRIAIRATPAGVVVSAPLLPQNAGKARIGTLVTKLNALMREIVDYAAESWIQEAE